jgi:hypothetical protein
MASIIDPDLAKSLIQEFRTQNAAPGGPALKTKDDTHLHGYFIDRKSLEDILSNPKVAGIHVYLAKHHECVGHKENKFTIVFTGSEANPKFDTASAAEGKAGANKGITPYLHMGAMYNYVPPCPPTCGGDPGTGGG